MNRDAPSRSRGTRLPEPFTVTADMVEWARSKGFGWVDLDAVTEEFCDYWRAAPGARGVKTDWTATWRNWIRTAARGGPRGKAPVRPRQPAWERLPDWTGGRAQ